MCIEKRPYTLYGRLATLHFRYLTCLLDRGHIIYCVRHQLFQCNFGIFIANEAAEENLKKKRDGSNKYLYELDFSSALKTARKFFMRRDSGRHIDIIRLMMKYVHAVKDRFRQFQRPLRGISAIHFGYR